METREGIKILYFLILFISIVSSAYGMGTIEGTISVKQDDNVPFNVIYTINLSASTNRMRLTSINLAVGSDINDKSLSNQYTLDDNIINLKQGSHELISIPVDFSSSKLNAGDFANWISDVNGTNYWDKAWYRAEIVPLVGDPVTLEAAGKPFFIKGGYLAEDSESIEIRTNQYPQIELKSPPNMKEFYISNLSPSVEIIFEYKPSDDVNLKNCTLYVDDKIHYPSEESPESNQNYTFQRSLNLSGNYSWYIRCCDNEGKCNDSNTRNLFVNYDKPPVVHLISHKNASLTINEPVEFRCKANDDQKVLGCTLYIDNNSVNNNPLYENDEYVFKHTFTGKEDLGDHEWYVQCFDNAQQQNNCSYKLRINLVSPPVVYVQKYILPEYKLPYIAYSKITDAISDSPAGGTIMVIGSGAEYDERNITIDKPLNLIGLKYPIINGDINSNSLIIKSNNVTIQGFKIVGSKIGIYASIEEDNLSYYDINLSNNILVGGDYGISLDGYSSLRNISIINNKIIGTSYGLTLYCPNYLEPKTKLTGNTNTIINNSISGCVRGIWLEYCPQIYILNNTLQENEYSIYVKNSQNGIIGYNNISRSDFGVAKCRSSITITNNTYSTNGRNEITRCL